MRAGGSRRAGRGVAKGSRMASGRVEASGRVMLRPCGFTNACIGGGGGGGGCGLYNRPPRCSRPPFLSPRHFAFLHRHFRGRPFALAWLDAYHKVTVQPMQIHARVARGVSQGDCKANANTRSRGSTRITR